MESGNLNARNLARRTSPSVVKKFSNKNGSTEHLEKYMHVKNLPYLGVRVGVEIKKKKV